MMMIFLTSVAVWERYGAELYSAFLVCFYYRVCGFVSGVMEEDRVCRICNMFEGLAAGRYDCIFRYRVWVCIIFCSFSQ